jgi:hypothetical protein
MIQYNWIFLKYLLFRVNLNDKDIFDFVHFVLQLRSKSNLRIVSIFIYLRDSDVYKALYKIMPIICQKGQLKNILF